PAPAPVAVQPPAEVKAPEPVWPSPTPEHWLIVNDYEKPADLVEAPINPKTGKPGKKENLNRNLQDGEWGDVGFNGGKCRLEQVRDGQNNVLKVTYSMPTETSECGTYEYLMPYVEKKVKGKLIKNYPQFFDLRPYDRIAAMVKSGDDKEHNLKLHLTELDPYGSQLQGYVSPTKNIVAGKDWQRVEFKISDTLHEFFDPAHAKAIGLRIRFQEQDNRNDAGIVLFDNITLIKKTGE
ncbi:MAG TPA: hypothetical protein PLB35_05965, partial [Myxococcota bacterium]|nr:hypothetical protein [Myxococcota bacterium]